MTIEDESKLKREIEQCMIFAHASAFVCITTMGKIINYIDLFLIKNKIILKNFKKNYNIF